MMHASRMISMMAVPMTDNLFSMNLLNCLFISRRLYSRRSEVCIFLTLCSIAASFLSDADARVEPCADDVQQEGRHQHRGRDRQRQHHDHRVVAGDDAL